MIYLAAPYANQDKEKVMRSVNKHVANFLKDGFAVYSPLSMGHYASQVDRELNSLPLDHWRKIERQAMLVCRSLYIITLPGWQESAGVKRETAWAREFGLPVNFLQP